MMLITGVLLIPEPVRAGVGVLITVTYIAMLNFYKPHKEILLFWSTNFIGCVMYEVCDCTCARRLSKW